MEQIFTAAGEPVWWADRTGGVCCGRPLKLAGEVEAARKMMEHNKAAFLAQGLTTLVTSCPICLKVFREDYALEGIEVLHHSEYIERLLVSGRLKLTDRDSSQKAGASTLRTFTYHDPCELGRGLGIYDSPRSVITHLGELREGAEMREAAPCCGSSLANIAIDDEGQRQIALHTATQYASTGAESLVTACPLCKKAFSRSSTLPVYDLAEIVAARLTPTH